ncbi:zinc finger protein AEBP2-like [Sceloporus undulatus]|uniref:zinc finger protein AEBP2-like n=1 Tax=Sceloporus undulatus TaxID=8520 RepID=UPI001C4AEC48|nr:zinc finger protein AEBP2-like [Sceloporus undulatus]
MGSGSSKGPSSRRGQGAVDGRGSPSPPGTASPDGARAASPPSPPPPPLDPELELLLGEVLEQVLEGSGGGGGGGGEGRGEEQEEDEDNQEDALRKLSLSPRAHLPSPSPPLLRLDAGDLGWRLLQDGVGSGGGGGSGGAEGTRPQEEKQDLPQKAAIATPESSNFANQVPPKEPDKLAKIVYDCSEEELMATIEQEYCR